MPLLDSPSSYPLLVNVRAYVPGVLDTRAGIVAVNSNSLLGLVHSIKRLNDPLPGAEQLYAIIVGAGSNLWMGQVGSVPSAFSQIDTGYSGNPIGFVPYRPPNSPESWLYVSDAQQMRKVKTDGTVFPQGIAPPLTAPVVDFAQPLITDIEDFNESSVGSWLNGGTAGALSANPGGRITDTITAPFNLGPGWVEYLESTGAVLKSGYGRGMRLVLDATPNTPETVVVSGIYPTSLATSLLAILYDSGTTGPCCMVPASPSTLVTNLAARGLLSKLARTWVDPFTSGGNLQVQPNSIFTLSGGTPATADVLVQSSTPGPLGTFSVRTTTPVTHAAGETLTGVSSFRSWDTVAHANPLSVAAGYFRTTIAAGEGTIYNSSLPVDLSIIGTRPTQPTDELHLSVRLDVPANLTEGRIILDVDSASNTFTKNYYYASFRASDLTPAVAGTSTTQSAIETSISTAQVNQYNAQNPGGYYQQVLNAATPTNATSLAAASTQSGTGVSQWTELFIPIANLIRVGTDTSRTLANVKAVQIYFKVSASTICDVHGLYLKGSYGPDVGIVGNDYYYRYRRRSSKTGAKSNPSPYNRSGIRPHGQRIAVTMPGDDTEADQLDVFRWGGSVVEAANGQVPWLYVGSSTNPGSGVTVDFNDDFADSDILNAEVLEFDNQQPYSTIDIPRSGTCTVVGTSVKWVSGDKFNTQWGPGSIIEINGVPYTLYAQPATDEFMEIVESATTVGSENQITSVTRPAAFDNPAPISGGTAFNNPSFAYDNNNATAATVGGPLVPLGIAETVTQVHRQNDWTNIDAVKVNDASFATVRIYGSNTSVNKSSLLEIKGFFANNPIPLTDTIVGISVAIVHEQFSGTSAVYDDNIKLPTLATPNRTTGIPWKSGSTETVVYGGPTDTWGGITPTPALLNDPNFGVEIGIECTLLPGSGAVAGITYVTVTAYTSPASGIQPNTHASCLWRAIPTVGSSIFSALTLSVLSFGVDLTVEQNCTAYVQYSLDGGTTWHTLWNSNNHYTTDSMGNFAPVTDSVSLSLTQDISQIQVRTYGSCPFGDHGSEYISINEIYVTASYAPQLLTSVPFILRQPQLLAQPMYAQWGPFLGYLQAVGDPYQPGVLHCTKPNQPDSGSDLLDVEITPPSEPLMNGCMYGNGASFVWSTQRMFQLAASSDLGLQFTPTGAAQTNVPFVPQEVTGSKGLFAPWFFCVGDRIYYGTTSGIDATSGGTPVSITDPYLSLLFPHDGRPGQPVTLGSATFYPPDFTQTQALRLFYEKNHVKFSYIDINGKKQVIVYSVLLRIWSQDDYVTDTDPQIISCYSEEGQSINRNLAGGLNYVYQEQGDLEDGLSVGWETRMAQVADFPGFVCVREAYVGLMSVTPVTLDVIADTTIYTQVLPSTSGAYNKLYTPIGPAKGKYFEWALTSQKSVRLFLRDCTTKVKPWAGQSFIQFEMFRDLNREITK